MDMKIYGVYDLKACAYMQPFFSGSNGAAMRAFGDAVNDGKSPLSLHPGDYQLFELGAFNDNSGNVVGVLPVKLLCGGADFVVNNGLVNATASNVSSLRDAMEIQHIRGKEVMSNGS